VARRGMALVVGAGAGVVRLARVRAPRPRRGVPAVAATREAADRVSGIRRILGGALTLADPARAGPHACGLVFAAARVPVGRHRGIGIVDEQVAVERALLERVVCRLVRRDGEAAMIAAHRDQLGDARRADAREQTRADPALALLVELAISPV